MKRVPDKIVVATESGNLERFSSLEVVNDLAGQSEATFEIGDDGSWSSLASEIYPGKPYTVWLNDRIRLVGRAEVNNVPTSDRGMVVRLTVRTRMADARYASADPSIRTKDVSIKNFVLACYAGVGLYESDFCFEAFAARDLMTGKSGKTQAPVDLEPINAEQAKINPPETIFQAVERHLKRHHAAHWDAPDGRILVDAPDDTQSPLYRLLAKRGAASKANNVLSITRVRDWSEVASTVRVYGQSAGRVDPRKAMGGEAVQAEVDAVRASTGDFSRLVLIPTQQVRDKGAAEAQAKRELTARSKRMDAWDVLVDGWSYWSGTEQINWATNTTVDLDCDMLGGTCGRYLIHRVRCTLNDSGCQTQLSLLAPGLWVL